MYYFNTHTHTHTHTHKKGFHLHCTVITLSRSRQTIVIYSVLFRVDGLTYTCIKIIAFLLHHSNGVQIESKWIFGVSTIPGLGLPLHERERQRETERERECVFV